MTLVLVGACLVGSIAAGLRWLRVAQREHYLPLSTSRFAGRWWTNGPANFSLLALSVFGVVGSLATPWLGVLVVVAQLGPVGLTLRGRTSPLAWTSRLKRVAGVSAALALLIFSAGALIGSAFLITLGVLLLPLIIDIALVIMGPVETRLGSRWVEKAAARLRASGAKVVAITGSYGKTTTKGYVTHLLTGTRRVVASPASFNNRMGLARAVNEQLVPGTEVFVAEMGTYGKGEIADLCTWIPPTVAALVSIGPVHLERFRTVENILDAKAEIFERAEAGVISVDHPLLAKLATEMAGRLPLVTVSASGASADVTVDRGQVYLRGERIGETEGEVFALNLGVAVAICASLGIDSVDIAGRLHGLPKPDHRLTVSRSEAGFWVIDDTYNSNPAGAGAALDLLSATGSGAKAVVTPGMVELGPLQREENRSLGARAGAEADHLVIVGATNRAALLEGSAKQRASVTVVPTRERAVEWVRASLKDGDAVLYENDLPDHYP